jgi:hypothetical protein
MSCLVIVFTDPFRYYIRAIFVPKDLGGINTVIFAKYFVNSYAAEAALASAHTRTGTAFDTVERAGLDEGVFKSVENFSLGNDVATADNVAVFGVALADFGFFFVGKLCKADMGLGIGPICLFGHDKSAVLENFDNVFADSGCR